MCIYHEALRNLTLWWSENGVAGVMECEVALALVVLPAKEKGHDFLYWFLRSGGREDLWQVKTLRKLAVACEDGLIDRIRDLSDERWQFGLRQVIAALQKEASNFVGACATETIFHRMMIEPDLKLDEILTIGVLQGVKPRPTCLQWYKDHEGESGREWPIPLLERLAKQVFGRRFLERFDDIPPSGVNLGLGLVRDALSEAVGTAIAVGGRKKRDCCGDD